MRPPNGTWIGTVVNVGNGRSASFLFNLEFGDDGSLTGSVTYQGDDNNPITDGVEGRWSPFGTLHIRCVPDAQRVALFDARFEVADELRSIIWGTILLATGERRNQGTAALLYAKESVSLTNHIWGN